MRVNQKKMVLSLGSQKMINYVFFFGEWLIMFWFLYLWFILLHFPPNLCLKLEYIFVGQSELPMTFCGTHLKKEYASPGDYVRPFTRLYYIVDVNFLILTNKYYNKLFLKKKLVKLL